MKIFLCPPWILCGISHVWALPLFLRTLSHWLLRWHLLWILFCPLRSILLGNLYMFVCVILPYWSSSEFQTLAPLKFHRLSLCICKHFLCICSKCTWEILRSRPSTWPLPFLHSYLSASKENRRLSSSLPSLLPPHIMNSKSHWFYLLIFLKLFLFFSLPVSSSL